MPDKKEIFITIAAGMLSNGTIEEGWLTTVTPEQLVEYREIIGLECVTKILSLYYELKEPNTQSPEAPTLKPSWKQTNDCR